MATVDNYDVVIVGGGLGGLTAGATLARKGLKVHLIESHNKVGGFATTFRRKKYVFEVAIHVIDGEQPLQFRTEIFDVLDIKKNIEFVEIPEFYECHLQGDSIKIPANFIQAQEVLLRRFPQESYGINSLFKAIEGVYNQMNNYMLRKSRVATSNPTFQILFPQLFTLSKISTGHFFDKLFNDPFLKATMLATITFYHNDRYELSTLQYLYALGCYLYGGSYYIKGGSQVFSDYLAKIITDNGGVVETGHTVSQLVVNNDQVSEVIYQKNYNPENKMKSTKGRYVIANAAIPNVYNKLIKAEGVSLPQSLQKAKMGTSAVNIFCGIKDALNTLGNKSYLNIFLEPAQTQLSGSNSELSFGVIDNHIIDTGICAPGVNTCEIIYMDNLSSWQSSDENYYKEKKEIIAKTVFKKMENYFPGFTQNIDLVEVGTPETIIRYTSSPDGAIYGFRPDNESFFQKINRMSISFKPKDEKISNLYFASAWSFMPGFTGSMCSGYQAAVAIGDDLGLSVRSSSPIVVD